MTLLFAIIAVVCIGLLIAVMFFNKKLEGQVTAANQETQRIYSEAQATVAEAQKQIAQQSAELKQD